MDEDSPVLSNHRIQRSGMVDVDNVANVTEEVGERPHTNSPERNGMVCAPLNIDVEGGGDVASSLMTVRKSNPSLTGGWHQL